MLIFVAHISCSRFCDFDALYSLKSTSSERTTRASSLNDQPKSRYEKHKYSKQSRSRCLSHAPPAVRPRTPCPATTQETAHSHPTPASPLPTKRTRRFWQQFADQLPPSSHEAGCRSPRPPSYSSTAPSTPSRTLHAHTGHQTLTRIWRPLLVARRGSGLMSLHLCGNKQGLYSGDRVCCNGILRRGRGGLRWGDAWSC